MNKVELVAFLDNAVEEVRSGRENLDARMVDSSRNIFIAVEQINGNVVAGIKLYDGSNGFNNIYYSGSCTDFFMHKVDIFGNTKKLFERIKCDYYEVVNSYRVHTDGHIGRKELVYKGDTSNSIANTIARQMVEQANTGYYDNLLIYGVEDAVSMDLIDLVYYEVDEYCSSDATKWQVLEEYCEPKEANWEYAHDSLIQDIAYIIKEMG